MSMALKEGKSGIEHKRMERETGETNYREKEGLSDSLSLSLSCGPADRIECVRAWKKEKKKGAVNPLRTGEKLRRQLALTYSRSSYRKQDSTHAPTTPGYIFLLRIDEKI